VMARRTPDRPRAEGSAAWTCGSEYLHFGLVYFRKAFFFFFETVALLFLGLV
jgi:hypothetical protein